MFAGIKNEAEMGYVIDKGARCTMIGYGSWATALMKVMLENEPKVGWYIADPEVLEHIRTRGNNPRYLSELHFDVSKIELYGDIDSAVSSADIVILCVPSAFLQATLAGLTVPLNDKFVVSAIKGIIPGDYLTIAEFVNRSYGVPFERVGIIAGPSHSEEVAMERLSYLTMVCKDIANARVLCDKFATPFIRTNPSTDIYGTEYAAVLKNIYALGVGIAVGLGYGDNFLAVLVSNAATEMKRFLKESYDSPRDITTSPYLGDLLVTCYSQFSRNRTFGTLIGRGYSVESAMTGMNMIAEGYYAAACIRRVNERFDIDIPIADAVYRILYERAPVAEEMEKVTARLL